METLQAAPVNPKTSTDLHRNLHPAVASCSGILNLETPGDGRNVFLRREDVQGNEAF